MIRIRWILRISWIFFRVCWLGQLFKKQVPNAGYLILDVSSINFRFL